VILASKVMLSLILIIAVVIGTVIHLKGI